MSTLLPNLVADISDLPWIAIIAVTGSFLIAIVGMIAGLWFVLRRQQMWHETARIALEKGQPLPKPLDDDEAKVDKPAGNSRLSDIRTGLILIAVGGGLFLFFQGIGGKLSFVGFIPGFIGAALLLFGLFSAIFGRKDTPQS